MLYINVSILTSKRWTRLAFEQQATLLVGLSIQHDVVRSAPRGVHYHADVIYLLHLTGNKEGSMGLMLLRVRPASTRLPTHTLYTPVDSTPPAVCDTYGTPSEVATVLLTP